MMVVPSTESPRAQPYLAPSKPTKPRFFVENERFREIEKRKAIAALKLAAFEAAKDNFVGYDPAILQQQENTYNSAIANIDGILQNFIAYVNTLGSSIDSATAATDATNWLNGQIAPYLAIPQIQALQWQMQGIRDTTVNGTPPSVASIINTINTFANERRTNLIGELQADSELYDTDKLGQNRDRTIATLSAIRASGGDSALMQTLSGMFYYDETTGSSSHVQIINGPRLTQQPILDDRGNMTGFYNGLNASDKAILDRFRRLNKIGAVNSGDYNAFKGANRESLQEWERREDARHLMNWTIGVMSPIMAVGAMNIAIGYGFLSAASSLRRSIWTRWLAPVFDGLGWLNIGIGAAITAPASLAIYLAVTDYNNKDNTWSDKRRGMDSARDEIANELVNIKQKEEEYLQAQAALDYFTKAPSMSVMKERLIQYGTQTNDNAGINKYTLTEADLRYMFDSKSNYVDSAGTAYTPNAVDAGRVLNVSSATATPKFQTASGDKYDPTQTTTDNLEATLAGGLYWKNGDAYVKIKQMDHTGQMVTAYALKVANDIAPGGNWDVYSLGDVMNMTNNHGDALRAQLKQNYFAASNNHERTLMLSERDKTMWQLWDYAQADQIGTGQNGEVIYRNTQYGGFRMMAADYAENTSAVFQTQQQQNASLVTQQWDLRRAELDAARTRWENLANTIESRGMESFNASEQKFLKAWRQWEIDTNRKIDSGKKQWDNKIKTFLVEKQNWQEEIKQAALEKSLEKMLAATGSSLNERLRALAENSGVSADIPQMDLNQIIGQAVADFERSRPSNELVFGEINKAISAFNVTLSMGNATHFKGFNSSTLEGNFAAEYGEFGKKMAILNNVKLYENFKKMVEQFKDNLRKNDKEVFKSLESAATGAGYRLAGGSYVKEAGGGWGETRSLDFMAYRMANIEGMMDRGMREAGLDMKLLTSGEQVVNLLEKKSELDVKLFFEVQTMALEQAFKLVGGSRGTKGYYQDYSGERALWKGYGGDLISEGAGEQGGWADGSKWHKLAWRGLHEEETKLQNNRQSAQTVGQVTGGAIVSAASIAATIVTAGAAAPAVAALMTAYAGMQTTIQVGSSFSSNRADQAWGQLQMGMLQMGISGLGSFLGGVDYFTGASKLAKVADAVTKVVAQNAVSYAGSGFHMNEDGSIGYKGPSKGALYSTLVSTGFGAVGAGINAGTGAGGWQAGMVSTTANALGAGFQFNDDGSAGKYDWGKAGVSFAANTASTFASYGTQVAMKDAGYGRAASGVVANQVGRAANVLTASLLGDQNAYQAYMPQGFFSTVGTNLGDVLADRFNNRNSQRPSSPSQPLREIFGGATMITARREEEEHEDEQRFMRLLTLSDTAEAQDELAALAARGAINGEQYAAAARQILANGVKDGGTAKLPLVATNSDRLFGNLGKQYGASTEEMEFRYVMANNPGLDPNDGDAYAAARDNLRAKIEKGGVTINMPTGVGEYTGQTDKQFGYNTIRAERAETARVNQLLASILDSRQASPGPWISSEKVGHHGSLKDAEMLPGKYYQDAKLIGFLANFDSIRDARMALEAYNPNGTQSVLGFERVSESALKLSAPDLQLVNPITGFKSALFSDGRKHIYAVAGTDMNESKEAKLDWFGANIPQALGNLPNQYVQAVENAKVLSKMYGGGLSFTGHSLGGSLASIQSLVTGKPATTFNAAPLHQNTLDHFKVRNLGDNQIGGFYVRGEILDDGTRFGQMLGMPLHSFNTSALTDSSLDRMENVAGAFGAFSWQGKVGVGFVKTVKHDLNVVIGALYQR